MNRRSKRIKILVRRIGPMRTMLLVALIDTMPHRNPVLQGLPEDLLYFVPDHSAIIKVMKIRQPVYWHLMQGLCERGLVERRDSEQHGRQYRVHFGAIEQYCRLSWVDALISEIRRGLGIKTPAVKG